MALSDYLTSEEWDGCFYCYARNRSSDFGTTIQFVIAKLLASGYKFAGFDSDGNKYAVIHNTGNGEKFAAAALGTGRVNLRHCIINGREFIKQHIPELLNETDEEWQEIIRMNDSGRG